MSKPAASKKGEDIININVGGKKYTVQKVDLLADSKSKLAEWFKGGTAKTLPMDKGGNFYLDRDPKTFRHILTYLRVKREKCAPSLALPSKPDDLAKLVIECEALKLHELKELAFNMLKKYSDTEEQHYVTSFVQVVVQDYESWQFDQVGTTDNKYHKSSSNSNFRDAEKNGGAYDDWGM